MNNKQAPAISSFIENRSKIMTFVIKPTIDIKYAPLKKIEDTEYTNIELLKNNDEIAIEKNK